MRLPMEMGLDAVGVGTLASGWIERSTGWRDLGGIEDSVEAASQRGE